MMSSSDAIIWNIEKDPHLRSTVMSVWILDEAPTPQRMAENIERMVAAIPRLRQRVVDDRPRPRWDPVHSLDVSDHYVCEQLASGSDQRTALDYAEKWVREPFDRNRPLWKLALLTGLQDGKAAVVIKVHHAIADGMGMVLMLGAFTDFERHPAIGEASDPVMELPTTREAFSPAKRFAHKARRAAQAVVTSPRNAIGDLARTLQSAVRLVTPHRTPHSTLLTGRSDVFSMDTRSIPFRQFKTAADHAGITMNDLFVSILADAIVDYHVAKNVVCPRLRVHMPVDIRSGRTANLAGNQFVPARVSLDLRPALCADQRHHVSRQLEVLCAEPALQHINTVSAAIQRLGKPISRWVIGGMMKGVDLLASNVPGPNFSLFLAGGKVEQFYAFGPPAGAALNATMFSYDGVVSIGLTIDGSAVTDQALLLRCFDEVVARTFTTTQERLAS